MSLTDEAQAKVFGEVMAAVGKTLRQYAEERAGDDADAFREIVGVSSDALISTVMCMRLAAVGVDIEDGMAGELVLNRLCREASEEIWDIVERHEESQR